MPIQAIHAALVDSLSWFDALSALKMLDAC